MLGRDGFDQAVLPQPEFPQPEFPQFELPQFELPQPVLPQPVLAEAIVPRWEWDAMRGPACAAVPFLVSARAV